MKQPKNLYYHLALSLGLGLILGGLVSLFFTGLIYINQAHLGNSYLILGLPAVWLMLKWVKRNTLFFPTTVNDCFEQQATIYKHWSPWGLGYNFVGTWLGHLAGASLGREGTVVVLSSSLARIFKLDWSYWRPIMISAGFAAATGQPLVAVVFCIEMFSTKIEQKIFSLILAWTACLIVDFSGVPHLFPQIMSLGLDPWSVKLKAAFVIAFVLGIAGLLYKASFLTLRNFLARNFWLSFILVIAITAILYLPGFEMIKSLSLNQVEQISAGKADWNFVLLKYFFTLLCVAIGFWGGEFVPAILIGSSVGVLLAQFFQFDYQFGMILGMYGLFYALTNLKWTAFFLAWLFAGAQFALWILLCLMMIGWFNGSKSIYKDS